jgi:hypothetical protein
MSTFTDLSNKTHPYYNLLTKVESIPHLQVHGGPFFLVKTILS